MDFDEGLPCSREYINKVTSGIPVLGENDMNRKSTNSFKDYNQNESYHHNNTYSQG